VFKVPGGICNRLNLNNNGSLEDDSSLNIQNSLDNKLSICAEKIFFRAHGNKRADITIDGALEISEDLTVEGNILMTSATEELETNILTNDLLINDNIITLNKSEDNERLEADGSGIEIFKGEIIDRPYIIWNETEKKWEADDYVTTDINGEAPYGRYGRDVAFGLPENLTDVNNADNLHRHSVLVPKDKKNPAVRVSDEGNVSIGPVGPSESERLIVDGNIKTDGILFPDQVVFPVNPPLESADQQFDDHVYRFTSFIKWTDDPETDYTQKLQDLITDKDNESILINGREIDGVFELNSTIVLNNVNNLKIFCAESTKLKGNGDADFKLFTLSGECSNIEIHNIELDGPGTLVHLDGPVNGLLIENCKHKDDSTSANTNTNKARIIETSETPESPNNSLNDIVIKNNRWTSEAEHIVSLTSGELTNCTIENNTIISAISPDNGQLSIISINQVPVKNLTITNNYISGRMTGIHIGPAGTLTGIDITNNNIELVGSTGRTDLAGITVLGQEEQATVEALKISGNKINIQLGSFLVRGIAINNIKDVLIYNNNVYFNGRNAVGIESLASEYALIASNTFEGVKNFEKGKQLIDDNNVSFYNKLNLFLEIYIVRDSKYVLATCNNESTSCQLSVSSNDIAFIDPENDQTSGDLKKLDETDTYEIQIPDEFNTYRIRPTKDKLTPFLYVADTDNQEHIPYLLDGKRDFGEYTRKKLMENKYLKIFFATLFKIQVRDFYMENDKEQWTTAALTLYGGKDNEWILIKEKQDIKLEWNEIEVPDGFVDYKIEITKDGYDTYSKEFTNEEFKKLKDDPLSAELIKPLNIQIGTYIIFNDAETPTDAHIRISAVNGSGVIIKTFIDDYYKNVTSGLHTLKLHDGYARYEIEIEKKNYKPYSRIFNRIELYNYISVPLSIELITSFACQIEAFIIEADKEITTTAQIRILAVSTNELLLEQDIAAETNPLDLKDGYTGYRIEVEKDGYQADTIKFTRDELSRYSDTPLAIELTKTL